MKISMCNAPNTNFIEITSTFIHPFFKSGSILNQCFYEYDPRMYTKKLYMKQNLLAKTKLMIRLLKKVKQLRFCIKNFSRKRT